MKKVTKYRVYMAENCTFRQHGKLNTGWFDTEEEAIKAHQDLCLEHSDQSFLDEYGHENGVGADFISGDYKIEKEVEFFCDCGAEIDEDDEMCDDCEERSNLNDVMYRRCEQGGEIIDVEWTHLACNFGMDTAAEELRQYWIENFDDLAENMVASGRFLTVTLENGEKVYYVVKFDFEAE